MSGWIGRPAPRRSRSALSVASVAGALAWLFSLLPVIAIAGAMAGPAATPGAPPSDPETVAMVRQWNGECIACHTPQAVRFPPKPGMDLQRLAQALMDPFAFEESQHAGMACKTCHGEGYLTYPHARGSSDKLLACNDCHAKLAFRVQAEFDRSVHARNLSEHFGCNTCHDPHSDRVSRELADPRKIVAQDNGKCLSCHNSDTKFAELGGKLPEHKERPDIDKIHDWLPNTQRHWEAVRCIECHTPPSTHDTLALSHRILDAEEAQRNCVVCHSQDTALRTRLYRHMAQEETDRFGFLNSAILGEAYVIGATRNVHIDRLTFWSIVLVLGGVLVHGAVRVVGGLIRRRRRS
jgi:hypothetical protein